MWEPNNYTKITRTKTVSVKGKDAVTVDLRKEDPAKPDDIVVRYVPTPDDVVEAMCKMAKVTNQDIVYDLGCGDGRMVIMAVEKFKAKRGVGVDLDPARVMDSKENAKKHGVEDKVEFRQGDVLKIKDLPDATVILLYMGDDINKRLAPILQGLKPGTRVVSHRFTMGDWKPDRTETINSSAGYACDIHLWVIKGKKDKQ
jgi:precorrin-6B methylase 2